MQKLLFLSHLPEIVDTGLLVFLSEFMTTNKIKPRSFSTDEWSARDLRHFEYINFLNSHFICLGEKSKPG